MIKELKVYKCDYCNQTYNSEDEAIKCLNSHPIIFGIEEYKGSFDCWGKPEGDWILTDTYFKTYESALSYIKDNDSLRIIYKELK